MTDKSSTRLEVKESKYMQHNHDDVTEVFLQHTGNRHVCIPGLNNRIRWFRWNGHIWEHTYDTKEDLLGFLRSKDEEITDQITALGLDAQPEASDFLKKARKYVRGLRNSLGLRGLYDVLSEKTHVREENFDDNPDVVGLQKGYLYLDPDTGDHKLLDEEANRNLYITKQMNVTYDPSATCPRFDQLLREIIVQEDGITPDQPTIDWLDMALGYCLSGRVEQTVVGLLHGDGGNGKSVLLDLMAYIFGDYTNQCGPGDLGVGTSNRFDNPLDTTKPCDDRANLHGSRFAFANEIPVNATFNSALIKNLTDQTLHGRRIYSTPFTFKATHFTWLCGNHIPYSDDDTWAFWRRICVVPFYACFTNGSRPEIDKKKLEDALKSEASGILNRLLRGYKKLMTSEERRLRKVSELMERANTQYRVDNDTGTPREFVKSSTSRGNISDPLYQCGFAEFMQSYALWAESHGVRHPWDPRRVTGALKAMGIEKKQGRITLLSGKKTNTKILCGLHLRNYFVCDASGRLTMLAEPLEPDPPPVEATHDLKPASPVAPLSHEAVVAMEETADDEMLDTLRRNGLV